MSRIHFEQTPEFRPLVQQAASALAAGKPTPGLLKQLEAEANANGSTSAQEALLLQAVREGRPDTLKTLQFIDAQAPGFDLEVSMNPLPKTSSSVDISAPISTNPLGAKIRDRGEEVYGKAKDVLNFMAKGRLQDALDGYLADKPGLKTAVDDFLKRLPEQPDREAMTYVKTLLLDRQPALKLEDQQKLMEKLAGMAKSDYDHRAGANRELVVSALHDIALPSDICQHRIGTCAGSSAQIKLAQEFPQEYLKMLDCLALNKPYPTLNGSEITPNWSFAEEKGWQKSGRSPSSSLMQNAIMDFADGDRRAYASSSKDDKTRGGLYLNEAERIFEALFNQNFEQEESAFFGIIDKDSNLQLLEKLKAAKPSRDNGIYLSMKFDSPGQRDAFHAVLLVGIEGDKATLINPWGREETVKLKTLESRLMGALMPAGAYKPPAPPAPPDPDAEKHFIEALERTAREQAEKNKNNPEPIEPYEPVEPKGSKKKK
ncbi:MAG: hypothetical protein ACAI44_33110 [Candidatus Sericytochromatia bacterium]